MRGWTNVSAIIADEANCLGSSHSSNLMGIILGYIPEYPEIKLTLFSTPNLPGRLFQKIEDDHSPELIWHKVFLPYTECVGKIYTKDEIEQAKRSPGFRREFASLRKR
jgi:hypothetical protein